MRARWVTPRLAPSPITLARTSAAVTRIASLARSPTSWLVSVVALHIGADAAEPQQVDRRLEDGLHDLGRRRDGLAEADRRGSGSRQRDRLLAARDDGAARSKASTCRSPASSSAAARTCAGARPWRPPVSGSGSMKMSRWSKAAISRVCSDKQHAVAEHVARHVADADDGERRRLDVAVHLAEMPLHRFPGALGGDAHLLVVVAGRAARREGVVQPEAVLLADAHWRCRRRSPCPCRRRRRNRDRRCRGASTFSGGTTSSPSMIVGDRQQAGDEVDIGLACRPRRSASRLPPAGGALRERSRPWRRPAR